ncbi:ferritin-like domain-containing protein [Fulvimonas sp. R45]|uniref:ferritin-like domain-containing protein n=1 Tax=Fulvimonas sp. R45 TaxID=3045937 RepID=UPI00265D854B|nr:ferritin-like domain-containing protein [Fulvimonas sp. R45]MDO1527565.1 ferritin-like domain-containing protein [Fulvimonas sp. R45]
MDPIDAQPWTLDNLDFSRVEVARIRHDEDLFLLLCAASFAESAAQPRMHDLVEAFAGDREWQAWLRQCWQPEKWQHGHALAAYVRHVWPEFDWQAGFRAWLDAQAPVSTAPLERSLALAARCVAAAGAASHYRALGEAAGEPVLRQLAGCLKRDEVRHFNRFCQQLRICREQEGLGRRPLLRALLAQARAGRVPAHEAALRHVFGQCHPDRRDDTAFAQAAARVHARLRPHLAAGTTARMLLKPLDLPPRLQSLLEKPLVRYGHRLLPGY